MQLGQLDATILQTCVQPERESEKETLREGDSGQEEEGKRQSKMTLTDGGQRPHIRCQPTGWVLLQCLAWCSLSLYLPPALSLSLLLTLGKTDKVAAGPLPFV